MDRWDRVGRWAAYGAASALVPYLLVKVVWVVGALLGVLPIGAGFGLGGWVLLNGVTVGMAALGIGLALALVRPWGLRLPGRPVAFCGWTGAGFLVSVLPYAVGAALLPGGAGDQAGGGEPVLPGWEAALIQYSFVGTGIGLAVALPGYARRRWPELFAGRLRDGRRGPVPWPAVLGALVGGVWLYWALGGAWGIDRPALRTVEGGLLTGLSALWALAASAAVGVLARARPARWRRWPVCGIGWLGSGSMFAWSGWKLVGVVAVALVRPAGVPLPENLVAAGALHLAAVVAGGGMARRLAGAGRRGGRAPVVRGRGDADAGGVGPAAWVPPEGRPQGQGQGRG
ncbi:hypothetical protein MUU72_15710 [Streptomyces sp. RS10V-4]|uniref:hypothetical protein n=1 Tax=Streptomyces rhizoryzae TaxID=2932493 RepID=UPI00200499DF|nr:hypothetical protein [Streptomyces rhizoryzae]MCK7624528.1 hypothetical protein [Streptomyces rhizoryzae]